MFQATDSGWGDNSGTLTVSLQKAATSAANMYTAYGASGIVARYNADIQALEPWWTAEYPHGMAWGPDGSFYVVNSFWGGAVRRFFPNGTSADVITNTPGLNGLRIGPDGKLYLFQSLQGSVLRCNLDGTSVEVIASGLGFPVDGAFDSQGNLYVTNLYPLYTGDVTVWRIDSAGAVSPFQWGQNGTTGIALGPDGMLYVSTYNGELFRFLTNGSFGNLYVNGLGALHGMAFGSDGNLYVTNLGDYATPANGRLDHRVLVLNRDGLLIGSIANTATNGAFYRPLFVIGADTTPPVTTASISPPPNAAGWIKGTDTRVDFHAVDNEGGSGVKSITYELQNFPVNTAPGSHTGVSMSMEGTRWLKFHSEDNAGNIEAEQTLTLRMDRTNPVSSSAVNGAARGGPYYTPPSVTLSATDSLSGVAAIYYSVDGGPAQAYTGAFTVSEHGSYTISYWAVDVADNAEPAKTLNLNVILDTISPTTTSAATPQANAAGWINQGWRVAFTSVDQGGSGVKSITYQVPDFPVVTTAGDNAAVQGLREGILGIRYFAEDNAGNVEPEKVITIRVDRTPPVTTATGVNGNTGTVSLTATDALSGVESTYFRIDGGAATPYTATFQIFTRGDHAVEYWSVDAAGNEEAHCVLTVSVGAPRIRVDALELSLNSANPSTLVADITLTNITQVTAHLDIPSNGVTLDGVSPLGFPGVSVNLSPGETWTLTVSFDRARFAGVRRAELAINASYDGFTLRASRRVAIP